MNLETDTSPCKAQAAPADPEKPLKITFGEYATIAHSFCSAPMNVCLRTVGLKWDSQTLESGDRVRVRAPRVSFKDAMDHEFRIAHLFGRLARRAENINDVKAKINAMRRAQKISLAYDCWFRQKKESVFVARAFLSASKDVCLRAVGLKWDLGSRQKRAHLKDAINCEFNVPEIANRLWVCYRLEEERAWEVSQAYSDAYQNSLPYRSFTTAKKAVGAVVDGVRSALHPNIFRQQMEGERGNEGSKQAMIGVCSPAPYCEWPTPSAHPM